VPASEHAELLAAIEAERQSWVMALYPESREVLEALRARGVRIVLCSNWDWDLDDHVAKLGIDDLFDEVICSAWVGARKPHPRLFAAALEAAGAPAADVLFVGDSVVADIEGAVAAGIPAVHVWRGSGTPPPLPAGAAQVQDLRGVLRLVAPPADPPR
jgi:putative hydrolase of the HAD superfamily